MMIIMILLVVVVAGVVAVYMGTELGVMRALALEKEDAETQERRVWRAQMTAVCDSADRVTALIEKRINTIKEV